MDNFHIGEIVRIIINDLETKGYRDILRTIKKLFKDYRIVNVTDDISMYNIKNDAVDITIKIYSKGIHETLKNDCEINLRVKKLMLDTSQIHSDIIDSLFHYRSRVIDPYMKRFIKYRIKSYAKDIGLCRHVDDYKKVKNELDLNHSVYDVSRLICDKMIEDPFFKKFSDDVIKAAREYYMNPSFTERMEKIFVTECQREIETLVDSSFRFNIGLEDLQKMISEAYMKKIHEL